MAAINSTFEDRLAEVNAYLEFLIILEQQSQKGPPFIEGASQSISTQQKNILYSSIYLQLYSLVESTMTSCIDAIGKATAQTGTWVPGDLCVCLRKEWVRVVARTHVDLTSDKRLSSAVDLCDQLLSAIPIENFLIEKGGGGNWDDNAIEDISGRLGFKLTISAKAYKDIKRPIKDDLGVLGLVKQLRNKLAHGSISFSECAEGVTVADLIEMKKYTENYLREVVDRFNGYIMDFEFLVPERRPVPVFI